MGTNAFTLPQNRLCQTCMVRRPNSQGHWQLSDDGLHRRWRCNHCADAKARRDIERLQATSVTG